MIENDDTQTQIAELEYDIALLKSELEGCVDHGLGCELFEQLVQKRIELAVLTDTEGF